MQTEWELDSPHLRNEKPFVVQLELYLQEAWEPLRRE